MPDYRRSFVPGGTFFFTANLLERYPNDLLTQHKRKRWCQPEKPGSERVFR